MNHINDWLPKLLGFTKTPAYVFDLDLLEHRVKWLKEALNANGSFDLIYAIKANPFLIGFLNDYVDGVEVCSPGELMICKKERINGDKIVLSGVYKQKEDVLDALTYGVKTFTAESAKQLILLNECAAELGAVIDVLVRLTSGNQFGVSNEELNSIFQNQRCYNHINLAGIQYYSGTQKKLVKICKEIDILSNVYDDIESNYYRIERLEYGPGWAIDYFGKGFDEYDIINQTSKCIKKHFNHCKISIEIGRFLVAECGYYITKVVEAKINNGQKYAIVDGGIHHVNYFGNVMGVQPLPISCYDLSHGTPNERHPVTTSERLTYLCGSLCTTADILTREFPFEDTQEGDILVLKHIGAYSVTEGMYLFLSHDLPTIMFLSKEKLIMVRNSRNTYSLNSCD